MIGAGLAGLATALELVEAGRDVIVLEAQGRPGGRILTLREPFADGLHVEAGATHVVRDPDLLTLLAKVGVHVTQPKRTSGLATIEVRDGIRRRFAPTEEPPSHERLSDEERRLGFVGCLEKYFADVKDVDPATPWPAHVLAHHDAQSAAELLLQRGASQGYVDAFGFTAEELSTVSGAFVLREMAGVFRDMALPRDGRIEGGADRLPIALAGRLGTRVRYHAVVKRIERGERGVRVTFLERGSLQELEAARVVCAIPYSVLRSMEVSPPFSPGKAKVIRELRMVSTVRMFAEINSRIWEVRGESGDAETDLPVGVVRDETKFQPGKRGVLGAYVSGDRARRIGPLTEAQRLQLFLDAADAVHPGAKARYVRGITHSWDEDPFARGAHAWFAPGEMSAFGPFLAGAEGRVHFAGDHTSHRPGWMHGALASAKRAAREVLAGTDV